MESKVFSKPMVTFTSLKTSVLQKKLEIYVFRIPRGVRCGGILAEGTINFSPYARWRCPNHCVSMALRQAPWSGSA